MAVQWADNFQNYGTDENNLSDGIYSFEDGLLATDPDPDISTIVYHVSKQSAGNDNPTLRKAYNASVATVGVAFRCWFNNLPANANDQPIFVKFGDINNDAQVTLVVRTTGAITAYREHDYTGAGETELATSAPVITANAWHHIEVKLTVDDAAGAIEVRVNGATVINETNIDTKQTANAECSQVNFNSYSGFSFGSDHRAWFLKDLILWDTVGSQNNDFMGSCHIYSLRPDADETMTWTPSTGTTGFDLINENDADDTDYISSDYVTNLALQSETLDNATWTKTGATITTNASNDGDGNATLDTIVEDSGTSDHKASQSYTFTADPYIMEVDVRDNGCGFCRLEMADGTNTVGAQFDLSDGSITANTATEAEAIDLDGAGLWRLRIRNTMAAGSGSFTVYCLDTHGGSTSYTGDGSSGIDAGRVMLAIKSDFTSSYTTTTTTTAASYTTDPTRVDIDNLPPDIVSIKALVPVVRAAKSDGGDGNIQVGLDSNGSVDLGADRAITASFTYWWDVSELSPDTGVAYTPLEVDNVVMQLDRTA